jgi:hypothetical protein
MGQDEVLQDRNHKWISSVLQEPIDPVLKSSMERELRAYNLVLGENQKQKADRDS